MKPFQKKYGDTNPVAKIAEAYGLAPEIAYAVADYFIHSRKMPTRLVLAARSAEDRLGDYDAMVAEIHGYAFEFFERFRGKAYAPSGPIVTREPAGMP